MIPPLLKAPTVGWQREDRRDFIIESLYTNDFFSIPVDQCSAVSHLFSVETFSDPGLDLFSIMLVKPLHHAQLFK